MAVTTQTEFQEAKRAAAASAEKLSADGLISGNELERARPRRRDDGAARERDRSGLEVLERTSTTQLALQRAQVERLTRDLELPPGPRLRDARARGRRGVLQEMSLEVGQWVNPGALLAKVAAARAAQGGVAHPGDAGEGRRSSARRAVIDTRNGTVPGAVERIDPAVQDGTVTVDVRARRRAAFASARPDLSVDGTIEIERIANTAVRGPSGRGSGKGERWVCSS